MTPRDLAPRYDPKAVEEPRYQRWETAGVFRAAVDRTRTPYTIVIPPPNVTGILHMGHALNNTIQDILIRYRRLRGNNALWVPGTDHAGIATQNVVERALAKEGTNRHALGRDTFVQRVWAWKEQYGHTIIRQLKRLGAACDWDRTRFTMDEGLSAAVVEVFLRLHQQGLIYRGQYIINWCPRCQTALSDEEAPRQETAGKLYHIRYPLVRSSKLEARGKQSRRASSHEPPAFIEVATTRPETMLGDTAIAVHPKDRRYRALIGQHACLPLVDRRLPIIADEMVDRRFGTGAVKVTPAHDPADFQLGRKHQLEFLNVMTDDAHMTGVPKPYDGLDRFECRSQLIVDLERAGALGKIDEHTHNVGHCYRCHTVVEPRLSPQWFVKMAPLARPAIKAVKDGTIRFYPSRWTKVYLNWMEHIQDWCISRQIWWGHRLPVWYCAKCARGSKLEAQPGHSSLEPRATSQRGTIVSRTKPAQCPTCGGAELTQDEDVLDTWFSSWLWPFSTLGWPGKTKDLAYFYPTSTLVTAQEIIFFWVARMIMAGYFCMKQPPFTQVYIHGTVRDLTGKKMSKSLGNIIDPLEIIDQYGTDALRYTLVTATAIGQDVFLSEERFVAGRNFANKLWNATRYVLSTVPGQPPAEPVNLVALARRKDLTVPDRWLLSRLGRTITRVTDALEAFKFNDAATAIYDFLWHDYCDWYVEGAKHVEAAHRATTHALLVAALDTALRLLHPIMPYLTEELWSHLRPADAAKGAMLQTAAWPKAPRSLTDAEAERAFGRLMGVVQAIRNTRAALHVPTDSRPAVQVTSPQVCVRKLFEAHRPLVQALAAVGDVRVASKRERATQAAAMVVYGIEVLMPLAGVIDPRRERARLESRQQELKQHLAKTEARLKDRQFAAKAPEDVVAQMKARREQLRDTLKKTADHLAVVRSM